MTLEPPSLTGRVHAFFFTALAVFAWSLAGCATDDLISACGAEECCTPGESRSCGGTSGEACSTGTQTCGDDSRWGTCMRATTDAFEACNGLDDDCDTLTADGADEPTLGDPCDGEDADLCEEGIVACGGGALGCSEPSGDAVDLCDGLDNDCDPNTPDGSGAPTFGDACDGPDADACEDGVVVCAPHGLACGDDPASLAELCDGIDNDCDPTTPDGSSDPRLGQPCDGPDGDLCAEGLYACAAPNITCSDATGDLLDVCDGVDNDCDVLLDEDFVPDAPILPTGNALGYEAHWYAGDFAVDWRTTPPTVACPVGGWAFEGSSTWADPNTGDLLYYSNGLSLWNAADAVVPNGAGLAGNSTATETSFFAPVPYTNVSRLFVFVNDTSHVYVSVLDIATGQIDAATKNTLVASNTGEAIGGIDDGEGGMWLVLLNQTTIDSYHVTSEVIPAWPEVSSPTPLPMAASTRGSLRFSWDRQRIALASETPQGHWWASFDAQTGEVTSPWIEIDRLSGYSIDFSPDGRMIYYAATAGTYGWSASQLWQYDTLSDTAGVIANGAFSGVALAPDGNIYSAGYNASVLLKVSNPNVGGVGNVTANGLGLGGCHVGYNLSKQLRLPTLAGCQNDDQCDDGNPCTQDTCEVDSRACTYVCSGC